MELGDVTGGRWLVGARVHSLLLCHPSQGKNQCIVAPRFDEKYPLVVPHQVWHLQSGWPLFKFLPSPLWSTWLAPTRRTDLSLVENRANLCWLRYRANSLVPVTPLAVASGLR
jgi:hypothetical protein